MAVQMRVPTPLPPLAQVHATLCHAAPPGVAALSHVADFISACVDISPLVAPARAAASGSPRLFTRVVAHRLLDANVAPVLRDYSFAVSLDAALKADDLVMCQTIHGLHPEPLAVNTLQLAMVYGSLELVQWVLAHRHVRGCCSAEAINLCRLCAEIALKWIEHRDPFRVASWIISQVFLGDGQPLTIAHSELFKGVVSRALWRSTELVQWFDHHQVLTPSMIDELVETCLREPDRTSAEIVQYFLEQGHALDAPERLVTFLIKSSCLHGQDERVERLLASKAYDSIRHEFTFAAFRPGGSKVLQWSQAFDTVREGMRVRDVVEIAAYTGNVSMVEYLLQAHSVHDVVMPYINRAPEEECLSILNLLHAADALQSSMYNVMHMMHNAVRNGHLRVVQWLHEHQRCGDMRSTMDLAAEHGHLHIVRWLHENRRMQSCSTMALNDAAASGHLDVVQWLRQNRREGDVNIAMVYAAVNGRLDVLMWLYRHEHDACAACVRSALLAKSKVYARPVHRYGSAFQTYTIAALYTLQWLDQHNGSTAVACTGNAGCVDGIHTRQRSNLVSMAVQAGDLLLLEYLHQHHRALFRWRGREAVSAMNTILNPSCLPAVQWVYARHPRCCSWRQLASAADQKGLAQLSQWLHSAALTTNG